MDKVSCAPSGSKGPMPSGSRKKSNVRSDQRFHEASYRVLNVVEVRPDIKYASLIMIKLYHPSHVELKY